MSGIVGLFNLDGAHADSSVATRMLAAIAHRGPDRSCVRADGAVALGHALLATTPESAGERQPFSLPAFGLSVTFDGRLDNREELDDAFARARIDTAAGHDAAYALSAYRCWGDHAPERLLGDFAFAIWDGPRQRLFCARDIAGIKGLYVHRGARTVLVASEPQALLAHPDVTRRLNEGMVGEHLSVVTSVRETLFADIERLPPAHRLIATRDRVVIERYWSLDGAKEIRYRTDDEYAEHLRGLLTDAVRARLRSLDGAGVMVSGGVDSSSLMGAAMDLAARGVVRRPCSAWSVVDCAEALDETPFMDEVVRRHGCESHRFPGDAPPLAIYEALARARGDLPPPPNAVVGYSLKRAAAASGTRVLLTGFWGDEFFSGSYVHCADLFRALHWGALARTVRAYARRPEYWVPPLPKVLVWPQLPRRWRKSIKMAIGRDGIPPWVDRAFGRRINLADRLYPIDTVPAFPTLAQEDIYRETLSGRAILETEEDDRSSAACGVEMRHPFADRRIMEFSFAVPEDQRCRDGVKKFVLRQAMRAQLPARVGARLTSADGSTLFLSPVRALEAGGSLASPAIERRGWTVAGSLRGAFDRVMRRYDTGDDRFASEMPLLWRMAAVEIWMREAVDGHAGRDNAPE